MNRVEKRNQKRKEVVEAIVVRSEPVTLVARVFNILTRAVFGWLARYRPAVRVAPRKSRVMT